jgi:hypothetical protein
MKPPRLDFSGLIDMLSLLIAQSRAYERILASDSYQARAAVAAMGKLAQQAQVCCIPSKWQSPGPIG